MARVSTTWSSSSPTWNRERPAAWWCAAVALWAACVVVAPGARAQTTEVIAASGDVGGSLPLFSAVSEATAGPNGEVAFLASMTGAFRRGVGGLEHVFGIGQVLVDGTIAGVGLPALDEQECVLATLAWAGGGEALYRRCDDMTERLLSVGDMVEGWVIARLDLGRPVSAGPYVAALVDLDDGTTAIVRVDDMETRLVVRTGDASPSGGSFVSLRLAGVAGTGMVGFSGSVSGGRDGLFRADGDRLDKLLVAGDATAVGRIGAVEGATQGPLDTWAFLAELDDGRRGILKVDARDVLPLIEPVAMQGDAVAGRPGTLIAEFVSSLVPSLNTSGSVAFRAGLGGDAAGSGVFVVDPDAAPRLLFSTRDETAVGLLARLRDPQIAEDGSVVVGAKPRRAGASLYVHEGGQVSALAEFGESTDLDAPDRKFRFLNAVVRGRGAEAVFFGQHDTLWRSDADDGLRRVARQGDPSPIGGIIALLGPAVFDSRSDVTFRAEVMAAATGEAIFRASGSGLVDVVIPGRRAPKGGRFRDFPAFGVEAGGDLTVGGRWVGFLAGVEGSDADVGLFRVRKRKRRVLERQGRRAPEGGEYVAFGLPSMVTPKRYAFVAEIRDKSTRAGVVTRMGRRRRLIAREGRDTGTRIGLRFEGFGTPDATRAAVVFRATFTPGTAEGIFLHDWRETGLLVASGDDVGTGTVRSFGRPVLAGGAVVFRTTLTSGEVTVHRSRSTIPPAPDAPAVPLERVLGTGDASPIGGRVVGIGTLRGAPDGAVITIVDLAGARGRTAVLRIHDDAP